MAPDKTNSPPNCLDTGICLHHGEEIERRRTDRKDIAYLKEMLSKLFERLDAEIPAIKIKVFAIFLSMGLMLVIVLGAYSFTAVSVSNHRADMAEYKRESKAEMLAVKASSDRGEEILLAKLNRVERDSKDERDKLTAQLVLLLTSDAENKEWQRGVMRQLELLNTNFHKVMIEKVTGDKKTGGVPQFYYDQGGLDEK